MTDAELLQLNAQGFIPGPGETLTEFLARITYVRSQKHPTPIPPSHWSWANEQLFHLYDFTPQSLPAFYSNKKLAPWEGAACWIENNIPTLQLRTSFSKGSFLKLYSRDEVLAHEAVHAARSAFHEPANEEFFAHSTSLHRYRRILGPILKHPREAWIFIASLLFPPVLLLTLSYAFFRLIRQHLILRRASSFLQKHFPDPKIIRAILFRMTDAEIYTLSKNIWPPQDETLRWRLIRLAYITKA